MPTDSTGRYSANPQLGRAMEQARAAKGKPKAEPREERGPSLDLEQEQHGAIHHLEYHPHPDGDGRVVSQVHHHDGHVEEEEHADSDEAAEHLREHGHELNDQDQEDEEEADEPEESDDDESEGEEY